VLFLWLHDWIPLGRLNDVTAVSSQDTSLHLVVGNSHPKCAVHHRVGELCGTWQWTGPMAMGRGKDLRLDESVPATAGALRKAGGHSRGILVPGVCSDLLALPRVD
jgi:hypothetical protein